MTARLFYIGLTHQSAPLSIRENVRADAEKQRTMLARLSAMANGRMVLGTCERFEIYATTEGADIDSWTSLLSDWFHVPASLLRPHLRTHEDRDAAEHLLRVAAGLESRIIGEAQILGQVRDAFGAALEMNALDAELSTLGRTAIRAGKRVRSETTLASGARSIAAVALDDLTAKLGDLRALTVAVIGTGHLAEVVLSELRRRAIRNRIVVGRDLARIKDLGLRFEAGAERMSRMAHVSSLADAVVVCTAAPTYVLDAAALATARSCPLWIFDLSVPRNVDPLVKQIPFVRLSHLDELVRAEDGAKFVPFDIRYSTFDIPSRPVASAPGSEGPLHVCRSSEWSDAERIVADELERFLQWRRERQAAPLIAELIREASPACERDKHLLHQRILRLKAEAAA